MERRREERNVERCCDVVGLTERVFRVSIIRSVPMLALV